MRRLCDLKRIWETARSWDRCGERGAFVSLQMYIQEIYAFGDGEEVIREMCEGLRSERKLLILPIIQRGKGLWQIY